MTVSTPIATGGLAGATVWATSARPDFALLVGVISGALVFWMRSKEPSRWKRGVLFFVSLSGGYYSAPKVHAMFPWAPEWLAGFAPAALIVLLAMLTMDWIETAYPQFLAWWGKKFLGGTLK